ncbi:hypothetical protein DPMN_112390 [Dreissena polymorpha]|uniref:Uncharacterized protein n=1 Tax=Dreissena polymorpha TaxID=45954 RepID=A0A9D4KFJ6_DREPO|nr:hypothetical protein DPMN_112390 [Dreissena polymorpha]
MSNNARSIDDRRSSLNTAIVARRLFAGTTIDISSQEPQLATVKRQAGLVWERHQARLLVQAVFQGTLEGGRRRGRQKKSRIDNVKALTSLPMDELLPAANSTPDWREISKNYRLWVLNNTNGKFHGSGSCVNGDQARGAPGLVMGPCIVEIDRIVIREDQYQLQVNRCKNEEVIVKGNCGWVWPIWAGYPRVGNGAKHKVQYQLEVNQCTNEEIIVKGNFGWAWPRWAGRPRFGNVTIHKVQYQFEVNRAIFDGCGLCGRGAPGLVMGPCIVEIDLIVIREVQYQFEVNRLKGNFGWVWSMWAGRPRIDRIVIREVQYQFEVNRCRNEEIIVKGNFGWIDRIVIREVQYQFEVNRCRNEEINFQGSSANNDGRTDRQTATITTISPRFSKSTVAKSKGTTSF